MDDKNLLAIIEKFGTSSIAELELSDGSIHLVLRKEAALRGRGEGTAIATTSVEKQGAPALSSAGSAGVASGSGHDQGVHLGLPAHEGGATAAGTEVITSPIVATFYRSPSPDAPPFVEIGSKVKAGQTLCILEAMKMMNHLEAEFDCEIVAIKAQNGDLVEYGQALFEVKRL
ncbi:acetyl-CoA carboxylase biotin carboxyl carrier protein [Treponema sp. J25]|uniref:acetyl-CoA carboxylase biotin carboxyl carrier protein n=1 Tax=Treponema sp. J25 TaxID=2094121 RepID=UPI00104EDCED|nr:acetyl-CoA carboxylase biotin carboxyl carrier protein [Treponema sp. J25]TCW60221.1 acetyl-CoA carboxylase biotin carboxyl carrier protein [Treponema sp. J25]